MRFFKGALFTVMVILGHGGVTTDAALGRTGDCFEYGYDYHGYDLHQVNGVTSPAACMTECAGYRGCEFWTYESFSRVCFLKSAAAFINRKSDSRMVSGPRQCTFSSECFDVGVDYYGYDIEKVEGRYVMNPLDCQRLCTGNPACAFFSWKFSTHSCFLKSSSALLGRRDDPDVTSGPRTCSTVSNPVMPPGPSDFPTKFDPATAPPPCFEASVEYKGYNIKTTKTKLESECQRQCSKLKECQYWSWNGENRTCALKNADALQGRVMDESTVRTVSGPKNCIPVTPGCQFTDVGVIGSRLTTVSAESHDACQFRCASSANCSNFTYDLTNEKCTFWASFTAYSKGKSTQGLISGPALCAPKEICYERADYVGHDVYEDESGDIDSPESCQVLCQGNPQCHYWTWLETNKGCYLKDANAVQGKVNDVTSLSRFSGPKRCSISYGCVRINGIFAGTYTRTFKGDNHKACSASCSSDTLCQAWTFHTELKLCSLTSDDVTLLDKPIMGTLAGLSTCLQEEQKAQDKNCFEEGVQYKLDNLPINMEEVKSADQCYALCQTKADCNWFTVTEDNVCYLIQSATMPRIIYNPTSISGPKVCKDEAPTLPFMEDNKYTGTPISRSFVFAPEACLLRCEDNSACAVWTYELGKEENNCLLFDKTAADTLQNDVMAISGMALPRVFIGSQCMFNQTPFSSTTVTVPTECQEDCQKNKRCEAWETTPMPNTSVSLHCKFFDARHKPTVTAKPNTECGYKLSPTSFSMGCHFDLTDPPSTAHSIEECEEQCMNEPTCKGWAKHLASQNCYLSTQLSDPVQSPDYVCSPVKRVVPRLAFDVVYEPAPLARNSLLAYRTKTSRLTSAFRKRAATRATRSGATQEALNKCIEKCNEEDTCTSWSVTSAGECSTFGSAVVPVTSSGAISGPKSTPQLAWKFNFNKKFAGDAVAQFPKPKENSRSRYARRNKYQLYDESDSITDGDHTTDEEPSDTTPEEQVLTPMECSTKIEENQCWSFLKSQDGTTKCEIYETCDETNLEDQEGWISGQTSPLPPAEEEELPPEDPDVTEQF